MCENNISQFWSDQPLPIPDLTTEDLQELKAVFGVAGDIKAVVGAPGYAVSDDGRVFANIPCSWAESPRELKKTKTGAGYLMVRLHVNKKSTADGIHRIVAKAFLPPPLPGQDRVRRLDGDPTNNNVLNLAWGTQTDNMADCVRHGRTLKGRKNPNAKLSERSVAAIRLLLADGFSRNAVASFFGVDSETIRRANVGDHWGHVSQSNGEIGL